MQEPGRPEVGQHVAVKAVGRAVHLVTFALTHGAESGVPLQRLVGLTGWEPRLVTEAASSEAAGRLHALTQRILADIDDERDRRPSRSRRPARAPG